MKDVILFCLFSALVFGSLFLGVRTLIFKGIETAPELQTDEQKSAVSTQRELMDQRQRDQRDAMRRQKQKIQDMRRR